jgi:hypothetical protein
LDLRFTADGRYKAFDLETTGLIWCSLIRCVCKLKVKLSHLVQINRLWSGIWILVSVLRSTRTIRALLTALILLGILISYVLGRMITLLSYGIGERRVSFRTVQFISQWYSFY